MVVDDAQKKIVATPLTTLDIEGVAFPIILASAGALDIEGGRPAASAGVSAAARRLRWARNGRPRSEKGRTTSEGRA